MFDSSLGSGVVQYDGGTAPVDLAGLLRVQGKAVPDYPKCRLQCSK